MSRTRLVDYFSVVIAFFCIIPVGFVIIEAFTSVNSILAEKLSLQNLLVLFQDRLLWIATGNTVIFASLSSLLALALGFLVSFFVTRTDASFKSLVTYAVVIMVTMPWFLEDMAWTYIANPSNGLVNLLVRPFLHVTSGPFNVYSMVGMIVVMGLNLSSVVYLLVSSSLVNIDSNLEDSSRLAGATLFRTLKDIIIGLSRPSILSAYLLCFMISAEAFDISAIIGAPAGIQTLPYIIYSQTYQTPPNYNLASAYSLILILITSFCFYFYSKNLRNSSNYAVITSSSRSGRIIKLGKTKKLANFFLFAYFLLYPLLVFGILIFASFHSFWNPTELTRLSISSYMQLAYYPAFREGAINTIVVSAIVALATTLLALYLSRIFSHRKGRFYATTQFLTNLPLVIPAIVMGLGFLWFFLLSSSSLYGTIWSLTIAYSIRYLPIATRFLINPVMQVSRDLEDASRISGANIFKTISNVTIPLLKSALTVTAVYLLIVTAKDLGVAVMLVSGNSMLVSYAIYTIWLNGHYLVAAASGVILVFALLIVLRIASFLGHNSLLAFAEPGGPTPLARKVQPIRQVSA